MQTCLLEDVLSVTNVLSLVLQSNQKDFGALRRPIRYTINQLEQIEEKCKTFTLEITDFFQKHNLVTLVVYLVHHYFSFSAAPFTSSQLSYHSHFPINQSLM